MYAHKRLKYGTFDSGLLTVFADSNKLFGKQPGATGSLDKTHALAICAILCPFLFAISSTRRTTSLLPSVFFNTASKLHSFHRSMLYLHSTVQTEMTLTDRYHHVLSLFALQSACRGSHGQEGTRGWNRLRSARVSASSPALPRDRRESNNSASRCV